MFRGRTVLFLIGLFLISSVVYAQEFSSALKYRLPTSGETIIPFNNDPVFLIGETVHPKEQEKKEDTFIPTPLKWEQKEQEISIQTLFGETFSVPYIEHIPYFFINVQLLSNGQLLVFENIWLIITPEGESQSLSRRYGNKVMIPQVGSHEIERIFVSVEHNYQPTPFIVDVGKREDSVVLTFPELKKLEPGLHLFKIAYFLPQALISGEEFDELFLSLLGHSLPYSIERMGILVTLPKFVRVLDKKVFFGDNNQPIDKMWETAEDGMGQIVFKTTHLLPPKTDIRLDFKIEKIPEVTLPITMRLVDFFYNSFLIWVSFLGICLIIGYYIIEIYFKTTIPIQKKIKEKVAKKLSYIPEVMRYVLYKRADARSAAGILLSLVNKGVIELIAKSDGVIYIKRQNKRKIFISRAQKYILRKLFSSKQELCVWDSHQFQNDSVLTKLVYQEYVKQYIKVTIQELGSGWILMGLCLIGLSFSGISALSLVLMLFLMVCAVLFGTMLFVYKSPYQMFIREAYEKREQHLTALLNEKEQTQGTILEKNIPVLIALDCIRRSEYAQMKIVHSPFSFEGEKHEFIPLTFIEKAVFNK